MSPMPAAHVAKPNRRRWSPEAEAAAHMLDRIAQGRDGYRLAEVEVRGQVVDMRVLGPEGKRCGRCGRTSL